MRQLLSLVVISTMGLGGWQTIAWAEDPSVFPEGSSSVIESLTWQITSSEQATLHQQVKQLLASIAEAMIVKETERLLVVSLPTKELPALRQALQKLGTVSAPDVEGSAPTTLLRLTFTQP